MWIEKPREREIVRALVEGIWSGRERERGGVGEKIVARKKGVVKERNSGPGKGMSVCVCGEKSKGLCAKRLKGIRGREIQCVSEGSKVKR